MMKIINIYRALVNWALVATIGVMVVTVTAQVIWRYLFNSPLHWTEEIARICLITTTFLGAALAIQKNVHFRIDALTKMLPPVLYRYAEAILCLLAALYVGVIVYGSIFLMQNINMGVISSLGIPAKLIYLVFPLGGGLMIINLLENAVKSVRGEGGAQS